MRYAAMFRAISWMMFAGLTACGGSRTYVPLTPPSNSTVRAAAPTTAPLPFAIHEYSVPNGPPGNPVVGADGLIWFSGGFSYLQMDRVNGYGAITVFNATPPPGETWLFFLNSISYAGGIITQYVNSQGFSHPELTEVSLARVTMDGHIKSVASPIAGDQDFAQVLMDTDSGGGLWTYVADYYGQGRLTRFVWDGKALPARTSCQGDFGDPRALATGPDGNVYLATQAPGRFLSGINKISPTCGILATFEMPSDPRSMAFGPDGALWIVFSERTNVIGHLTTAGAYTEYHIPFTDSAPLAITRGSDGAMWFIDAGRNAIERLTAAGTFTEFRVPTPKAFYLGGGIVSCPRTCERVRARLWFSEYNTGKIGKLELY